MNSASDLRIPCPHLTHNVALPYRTYQQPGWVSKEGDGIDRRPESD